MSRSASRANESVDKIKVYSKAFIDELSERGILDQQFVSDKFYLEKPSNYGEIWEAIKKDRPDDKPTEADYEEYATAALSVSTEAEQKLLYTSFFGNSMKIKAPHIRQHDERWTKHEPITGGLHTRHCKQVPHPDLAEGLRGLQVPRWIRDLLSGYSVPCERLAFPNFLVELKRDKSMFTAHVQNRHCGASASQAFVEYFAQLHEDPESPWNIARVGSIEFNGDCVVGNVHWVSSSDTSGTDRQVRKYHMTRILCRFTCGLSYEDFIIARKEARNFREFFEAGREAFLEDCIKQHEPQNEAPSSINDASEVNVDEDEDRVVSGPREASQPPKSKARNTAENQKRDDQAGLKGGGKALKGKTRGRKKNKANEDEYM
jgi:hypothetical protein